LLENSLATSSLITTSLMKKTSLRWNDRVKWDVHFHVHASEHRKGVRKLSLEEVINFWTFVGWNKGTLLLSPLNQTYWLSLKLCFGI
jgi:hypothetical protein